jgi:hypothetical protein
MDQGLITLIIVFAAVIVTVIIMSLFKVSSDKEIDLDTIVSKALSAYGTAATLAAAIEPFLPAPYNAVVKTIFTFADKAVHIAEEAYKAGTCAKDERKAKATAFICDALKQENIEIDGKVENLVDTATEMMVKTLPKTCPQNE